MDTLLQNLATLPGWGRAALILAGAALLALLVHEVLLLLARRLPTYRDLEATFLRSTRRPARLLLVFLAVYAATPLAVPEPARAPVLHGFLVAIILSGAWLLIGATDIFQGFVERRFRTDVPDNLRARRIRTRVRLLRRVVATVVGFVALAVILMTFEAVREVGLSLFASAGVAGLVVGIAAQPTLSNVVAGLQLALTEPIRLDDVVIVEGEWGWIEEITMTYVVVRIWDQRRLVIPLRWFIEHPFENWTRQTSDILGAVLLFLDYRAPLDALRAELRRVVETEGSEFWDGRVCNLQVVDTTERTVKVRALVSAPSSPAAWELRCLVRERLVTWLQEHHPEGLPTVRAEVGPDDTREGRTAPQAPTG